MIEQIRILIEIRRVEQVAARLQNAHQAVPVLLRRHQRVERMRVRRAGRGVRREAEKTARILSVAQHAPRFGARQAPVVDLPTRGEGERVDRNEALGDHVPREPLAQVLRTRAHVGTLRDDVSHQSILRYHHSEGVLNPPHLPQKRLDLPRLDTKAVHLDLLVHTPQKLHGRVRQPPHKVPRHIHHAMQVSRRPRVRLSKKHVPHEPFRRLLRAVMVPERHLRA
mmetsp:Transcript_55552/g.136132  ORF Transcript_55552/g.136132 Transcript_55552/m.136132 type:complete len:224 (-) Transcript_55552:1096-1767(-)